MQPNPANRFDSWGAPVPYAQDVPLELRGQPVGQFTAPNIYQPNLLPPAIGQGPGLGPGPALGGNALNPTALGGSMNAMVQGNAGPQPGSMAGAGPMLMPLQMGGGGASGSTPAVLAPPTSAFVANPPPLTASDPALPPPPPAPAPVPAPVRELPPAYGDDLVKEAEIAALKLENCELRAALAGSAFPRLSVGANQLQPTTTLKSQILLDPLVAAEIRSLRRRLAQAERELLISKENAATAATFTSDGPLGTRLLEKCRKCVRENEQLGEALLSLRTSSNTTNQAFIVEKEAFLMNQLKLLHDFNVELETECTDLIKTISRLVADNQLLQDKKICSRCAAPLSRPSVGSRQSRA